MDTNDSVSGYCNHSDHIWVSLGIGGGLEILLALVALSCNLVFLLAIVRVHELCPNLKLLFAHWSLALSVHSVMTAVCVIAELTQDPCEFSSLLSQVQDRAMIILRQIIISSLTVLSLERLCNAVRQPHTKGPFLTIVLLGILWALTIYLYWNLLDTPVSQESNPLEFDWWKILICLASAEGLAMILGVLAYLYLILGAYAHNENGSDDERRRLDDDMKLTGLTIWVTLMHTASFLCAYVLLGLSDVQMTTTCRLILTHVSHILSLVYSSMGPIFILKYNRNLRAVVPSKVKELVTRRKKTKVSPMTPYATASPTVNYPAMVMNKCMVVRDSEMLPDSRAHFEILQQMWGKVSLSSYEENENRDMDMGVENSKSGFD